MEIKLTFCTNLRKLPIINALKSTIINPEPVIGDILKKDLPFDATVFIDEDDYHKWSELLQILEKYGVIVHEAKIHMPPLLQETIDRNLKHFIENINDYHLERSSSEELNYNIFWKGNNFTLIEDYRLHKIIVEKLIEAGVKIK